MENENRLLELGKQIFNYRHNAGIKQDAFAKDLGISRTTLSLIENGSQAPSFETLVRIAQITNINMNQLINVETRNVVIVDTNILLNRPKMLDVLLRDCDRVIIPKPVIEELNFQKDHGKEKERRSASYCENIINGRHSEKLDIYADSKASGNNDDKILDIAMRIATSTPGDTVYLLTNDKDFGLKNTKGIPNLNIIGSNQYSRIFAEKDGYNEALSQRFFVAVLKRDLESAKSIISKHNDKVNVNAIDSRSGYTPLIQAIVNKDEQMVDFLLSLDRIDINAVDDKKHFLPPISHAMQMQNDKDGEKFARILIQNGANVNEPAQSEANPFNMPLMIAAWGGHLNLVKLLVENGAYINQQDHKNGYTALMKAIINKENIDIVKYLIEQGADINIMSFLHRKTALDYAYDKKNSALISLLKERNKND